MLIYLTLNCTHIASHAFNFVLQIAFSFSEMVWINLIMQSHPSQMKLIRHHDAFQIEQILLFVESL